MRFDNRSHASLEMSNARFARGVERPCGAFVSNLRTLPTISERSNFRVASIHTGVSIIVNGVSAKGQKRTSPKCFLV
jgi:hypothetical protein